MARICIDPGHGGFDPGAVGDNGLEEAHIALEVALRLETLLNTQAHVVTLTRRKDEFQSLARRCEISNGARADIFFSIHCNSAEDADTAADPEGIETLHATGSTRGRLLAGRVQDAMLQVLPDHRNRGVKASPSAGYKRRLYVLHHTRAPAALAELEFISSRRLQEWLGRPETWDVYAGALAVGIASYLGGQ